MRFAASKPIAVLLSLETCFVAAQTWPGSGIDQSWAPVVRSYPTIWLTPVFTYALSVIQEPTMSV